MYEDKLIIRGKQNKKKGKGGRKIEGRKETGGIGRKIITGRKIPVYCRITGEVIEKCG